MMLFPLFRHCEEQSDEAIQLFRGPKLDCFAEFIIGRRFAPTRWLAMTDGIFTALSPCPVRRILRAQF
jgi:hypothetical protein